MHNDTSAPYICSIWFRQPEILGSWALWVFVNEICSRLRQGDFRYTTILLSSAGCKVCKSDLSGQTCSQMHVDDVFLFAHLELCRLHRLHRLHRLQGQPAQAACTGATSFSHFRCSARRRNYGANGGYFHKARQRNYGANDVTSTKSGLGNFGANGS